MAGFETVYGCSKSSSRVAALISVWRCHGMCLMVCQSLLVMCRSLLRQELWKTRSRPMPLQAAELLDAETSAPPGTANGTTEHAKGLNASRVLGLTEVHKLWSLQVLAYRAGACALCSHPQACACLCTIYLL